MTTPLLSCRNVGVAYDKVQVLFGVDLDVYEGEIVALLGTNGAGKSTLLKAVSGIASMNSGSIMFNGVDITKASPQETTAMGIVQVPGGKAVFPTLSVAEHFRAGCWLYSQLDASDVARRTEEVLDMFPRLRERWNNMAGDLSGGEQQQLALAMAFVAKPKLLVIDELSLGLAPVIVERLLAAVQAIHDAGATIVLVEQSVNIALTVATRAYFMEKGQVRFEGPTKDLLEREDVLRSVFLDRAGKKMTPARTSSRAQVKRTAETVSKQAVLSVQGLSHHFGGIAAVNDVSFTVHEGEILGLIGPNGAGKTTIFDLISGHLQTQRGRIELNGTDISRWVPEKRSVAGLGRSFQDAKIFPSLTVAENIAIGLERHIAVRDHVSALFATPAIRESEMDVAFTADDLIELMGLGAFRDKFVAELSTGSRRIVDLAMSIAHDPAVLLLDEPSSGIAQKETEALGPLLRRIRDETDCAMLVIEHDMPLITSLSDTILALDLGTVLVQGTPDDVLRDSRVVSAYLGTDASVIRRSSGTAPPKQPQRRRAQKVGAAR
ncbi:MAG: ATP-binding cassette domain-containing protein [Frankiales bacterium]|nr:ATP-binding cassette domain-containing protein [Frankiales bacterium]